MPSRSSSSTGLRPISSTAGSQDKNRSEPSKTPRLGSSFGSLPLSYPETSHHKGNPKNVDHKFAVIDNKTVITGSFNWSPSAAHTNDETLLIIESPQLAKHFTREMDRLWESAELGITPHIQRKLERQKIRCGDEVERRIKAGSVA